MRRRTKFMVAASALVGVWQMTTAQPPPAPAPSAPVQRIERGRFEVQPGSPSPDGGGERRGGMRMMGGDPTEMFNRLSNGKDVITRDALDERQKFMFDMFARNAGVTGGQISRDQFIKAAEQMRSQFGGGGPGGGRGGPGGGGPGGGPGGGGMSPQQQDEFSVERFRRSDRNGDGFLDQSEVSERLRPAFAQHDGNKDGMLDMNEYKGYMKTFFAQQQAEAGTVVSVGADGKVATLLTPGAVAPAANGTTPAVEDDKPAVYRTGKLPKDIPSWFEQMDTDKDGQIGLYEWVKASRTVDDFRTMDRNDDGFIIIDELMTYVRNGNRPVTATSSVASSGSEGGRPDFRGMGGDGNSRPDWRNMRGGDNSGGRPDWRNMGKGGDGNSAGSGPGGFRGFGKGGDNGGGRSDWRNMGKGGDNNGPGPGGFRGFGKGGDNSGPGGFRGFGKGGEGRGGRDAKDGSNSGNPTTPPGASATPPATTPPADSGRFEGKDRNRREEKSRRP